MQRQYELCYMRYTYTVHTAAMHIYCTVYHYLVKCVQTECNTPTNSSTIVLYVHTSQSAYMWHIDHIQYWTKVQWISKTEQPRISLNLDIISNEWSIHALVHVFMHTFERSRIAREMFEVRSLSTGSYLRCVIRQIRAKPHIFYYIAACMSCYVSFVWDKDFSGCVVVGAYL